MRSARLAIVVFTLVVAACADQSAPTTAPDGASLSSGSGNSIPGQYIVVLRSNVSDVRGLARALTSMHGGALGFTYEHAIKGFSVNLPAQAALALQSNPNVAYIEEDQIVTTSTDVQNGATWGLDRVDQVNRPVDGAYHYDATGSGVTVYIIDTGIRTTHNEFGGRASPGYDAITAGGNADDCNGHGTHVAGTVGGSTYGIAKNVTLVAVRVLGCNGSGTWAQVIAGIDWVTANHAASAVANMSLVGGGSTAVDNAVSASIAAGVTYAVAAGNGNRAGIGQDACNYSPGRTPTALTVGATNSGDQKPTFSNYGDCVDLFAPGVGITSAWHSSNASTNTISGTSMATPHVAGVAALYLEGNPGAAAATVSAAILGATTKNIVTSSNTDNNDLLYSLLSTEPPPPPGNDPPTASFTRDCTLLACDFTDTSGDDDGSVQSWSWNFGDGATSNEQHPSHSYLASGTYTVTLTVTDDDGAASAVASQIVTVSNDPPPPLSLSASPFKVKGVNHVRLTWSGATSANVDVYRNGAFLVSAPNSSPYTDNLGTKGGGSATYRVCEAGTSTCSATISASW